jgi:patatin-like phospholipase/acyl hydrolase
MQHMMKIGICEMFKFIHLFGIFLMLSPSIGRAQFFEQEHFIKDIRNQVIWIRCSAGQVWDIESQSCSGEVVRLSQTEIPTAIEQANQQLGGSWRLPTLDELESLVCDQCIPAKIENKYFANIAREAYWTSTPNSLNKKMFWTVNFQTGHTYSRFFGYQELPFLLVKDY